MNRRDERRRGGATAREERGAADERREHHLDGRSQSARVQSLMEFALKSGIFSAFSRISSPFSNACRNCNTTASSASAYRLQSSPTRFAR